MANFDDMKLAVEAVPFRIAGNNAGHKVSETVPANVDMRRVVPLEPLHQSNSFPVKRER